MQLIEHDVVPGPAGPMIAPPVRLMVDRLARPVNVLGLEAGRRIGDSGSVREREAVECARPDPIDGDLEESALATLHRDRRFPALERQAHPFLRRSPKAETNPVRLEGRPMRPALRASIHA